MTVMAWEHPELFHIIPCVYNYQVGILMYQVGTLMYQEGILMYQEGIRTYSTVPK